MRQCSYTFDNDYAVSDTFGVIQNGCSTNEPTTVLSEIRNTVEHDKFGQVMFMHADPTKTKISITCTVDACLPPAFGVLSCAVESACAGRYDEIYEVFGGENDVSRRRRREIFEDEESVTFDLFHPCHLINSRSEETVCSTDLSNPCWTKDLCDARNPEEDAEQEMEEIVENMIENIFSESSATAIASTAAALFLVLL